ncbi:MtnX-like HAD-IB family phosphatase [Aerosticca soli]|uniref:2-hydroxy-3-keto-5-methylthiopentenyl-1-phosphate phosphatase related protein n=1 Tax=Aerosticca soli TaxID=2010829 RepID=A0A2Z6E538_9GAMM|nr:MtnX-like HAD-IB family phosphatase [Aerosticca soli]MDI3262316.1 MtnX-like HAD-IB family phosphatase [Fulvimonas sp.]BBD80226.1 2-hydroxy-3-keto-5-methylthiopentenyl-1-phosphate phosphatase related protein [Aerosticca soli]
MNSWTILCDFDGTIAVEDVIDSLLDRYGRPGWRELERDWRAGRIGSRECMTGQVALLDMSREELDRHLSGLWIDHAFPAFAAKARELGLPLRIVSDGLDYAIERILARYDLDDLPLAANHLRPATAPQRWQLSSPFQAAGCRSGTCKCACVEQARAGGARTLLIGDGASDFCAAERVDFVFAKHRLIEHCRASGIPYRPITGFEDALALLPALLEGRLTLEDATAVVP